MNHDTWPCPESGDTLVDHDGPGWEEYPEPSSDSLTEAMLRVQLRELQREHDQLRRELDALGKTTEQILASGLAGEWDRDHVRRTLTQLQFQMATRGRSAS